QTRRQARMRERGEMPAPDAERAVDSPQSAVEPPTVESSTVEPRAIVQPEVPDPVLSHRQEPSHTPELSHTQDHSSYGAMNRDGFTAAYSRRARRTVEAGGASNEAPVSAQPVRQTPQWTPAPS